MNKRQSFSVCWKIAVKLYCFCSQHLHLLRLSNPPIMSTDSNRVEQTPHIKGMFQRTEKCIHNTWPGTIVDLSFLLGGLQLWKLQLINGYPYTKQSKISWTDHWRRQGCEKKAQLFPCFCFAFKISCCILQVISRDTLAAANLCHCYTFRTFVRISE